PEVSQTHLDQTVKNWPLGQTLLITGGIHPGILDRKGGWLGTPIGAPSSTEVLVFLDAETVARGKPRASTRDTDDEADARGDSTVEPAADPPPRTKKARRATRGPDVADEPGN